MTRLESTSILYVNTHMYAHIFTLRPHTLTLTSHIYSHHTHLLSPHTFPHTHFLTHIYAHNIYVIEYSVDMLSTTDTPHISTYRQSHLPRLHLLLFCGCTAFSTAQ
jgi:hypothetical protein